MEKTNNNLRLILREKILSMIYLVSNLLDGKNTKDKKINKSKYLTLKEIIEMKKSGIMDFGSHTKSPPNLFNISLEEANEEIIGSKKQLEKILGIPITNFSYPYGGFSTFSQEHIEILKKLGYKTAVINVGGTNSKNTNLYLLRRICIGKNHSKYVVEVFISGLLHKLIGVWK